MQQNSRSNVLEKNLPAPSNNSPRCPVAATATVRLGWPSALVLAALLLLAACPAKPTGGSTTQKAPQAKAGGEVTLPLTIAASEPSLKSFDFEDPRLWALARATSLPLVGIDGSGAAQPGLARTWEHSADYKEWTFVLASEQFALDAGMQYQSFLKDLLRGKNSAVRAQLFDLLQGAAAYGEGRAEDVAGLTLAAGSLTLKLNRPFVELPLWLSQPALALRPDMADRPHGYGPFRVASVLPASIELVPNADSLGGRPRLDKLIFSLEPDRAKQVELYRQGKLDAANIPTLQVPDIEADQSLSSAVHKLTTASLLRASFDHGQFPWGDEQFKSKRGLRAGVNLILDKEQLAVLLNDQIAVWPHSLPQCFKDYIDPVLLNQPVYPIGSQVEDARAAIKDAGHEQGINLPRGMDLAYLGGEDLEEAADQILEYFNEITVLMRPFSLSRDELRQRVEAGTHEMVLERFHPAYPAPDAYYYPSLFGAVNAERGSLCRLQNKELDELLGRAEAEPDPVSRRKLYQQVSNLVENQALFLFAGELSPSILVSPELAGYSLGLYDFDASLPAQDFSQLGHA